MKNNDLTQADNALIHAYSDYREEEPQFNSEYLSRAKKALFMEFDDPKNDEPTDIEWARQFVAEGHYHDEDGEVMDETKCVIDFEEVVEYIELNYITFGPFMFIKD